MSALSTIAQLFGVKLEDAEAVIKSERGYRAALSRRSLFAAAGALAVGRVMVPGSELERRHRSIRCYVDGKYYGILVPQTYTHPDGSTVTIAVVA